MMERTPSEHLLDFFIKLYLRDACLLAAAVFNHFTYCFALAALCFERRPRKS
jgi:hypothetical protein